MINRKQVDEVVFHVKEQIRHFKDTPDPIEMPLNYANGGIYCKNMHWVTSCEEHLFQDVVKELNKEDKAVEIEYDDALNEAGWTLLEEIQKYQQVDGHLFNNLKFCLKAAIEKYNEVKENNK